MNPYILTISTLSLIMGTLIAISSFHWLLTWVGLEINTFAIIPLMAKENNPRAMEAAIKYFIIQSIATAILLFAIIYNAWNLGQWNIQQNYLPQTIMLIMGALALKLGLAPMHSWFPEIMQGLSLQTGLILSTWQKIAPLSLMLQLPVINPMCSTLLGLLSMLMGSWGILNQTQTRKILGYSSITNLGTMMMVIQYTPSLTFLAFNMYVILAIAIYSMLAYSQMMSINSLSTSWTKSPIISATAPLILLSSAGLPPLTGFLPKWMILLELAKQGAVLAAMGMMLSALMSLYVYLRIFYSMTLTTPPNNLPSMLSWRVNYMKPKLLLAIFCMFSLWLLPLSLTILTIFIFPEI
uniref:NADH-ubiquinone oxidoreductase chain 2 n=1 Tax=Micromoema xiphophora TaxID=135315 RepID=Q9TD06_9TELE|nr:NADH dehydrogenase subunit II [Micromoema xiphophora]